MINVAVFFGGISCEHDISIITAMQVINNLDKSKYNVFPVYIDKVGNWVYSSDFVDLDSVVMRYELGHKCFFVPNDNILYRKNKLGLIRAIVKIDIVIVAMHGLNGEDGAIKVVCNISGIKCICPNVLASALALNKCVFKSYLKGIGGVNVITSISYNRKDGVELLKNNIKKAKLNYPLILKPACLGSSIGISVCHNESELEQKINYSLRFDDDILIEQKLKNFKEYNIALIKTRDDIIVSEIEQPIGKEEILSYSDKYLTGTKGNRGGMSNAKKIFPARIKAKMRKLIVAMATRVYKELSLSGVVRFDFMYDCDNDIVFLNELNTIPGSFAYYLFPKLSFSKLLDICIDYEYFSNQSDNNKIKYFSSSVLKNAGKGIKK